MLPTFLMLVLGTVKRFSHLPSAHEVMRSLSDQQVTDTLWAAGSEIGLCLHAWSSSGAPRAALEVVTPSIARNRTSWNVLTG